MSYDHSNTYLIFRFGYVEDELNKAWEKNRKLAKKSKTNKRKNQKLKMTKQTRPAKNEKTPVLDLNLDSKDELKPTLSSRLQPNANKSDNPEQIAILSEIVEKISPNSTKSLEKMIPEVLRYQFFLRRGPDSSDCLLKVCDKYLHNYHVSNSEKKTESAEENKKVIS
jgi:hypothetical protein